jgi:hypothetical protein
VISDRNWAFLLSVSHVIYSWFHFLNLEAAVFFSCFKTQWSATGAALQINADLAADPEMEFLDINLTKDLSPNFYWRILKKCILFSGFKNPYKKISDTRKREVIHK